MMTQNGAKPVANGFGMAERRASETLIELAIAEDLGEAGDLTSLATIPEEARGSASLVARASGIVCGLPVAAILAERLGISTAESLSVLKPDGSRVEPGTRIATITGSMRAILAWERTALNFLQRLSGTATLTARFVEAVAWTKAQILDTRKTTPGWRLLEKYAVRCGGGRNHRIGLYDGVLIKDNHLASVADSGESDPIGRAVALARQGAPSGTPIEVEVDSLEQFRQALASRPDIILLDNFDPPRLAKAVQLRDQGNRSILLEASGGVDLSTAAAIARTGVDRISVGALTHSAPSLDIGLDFEGSD